MKQNSSGQKEPVDDFSVLSFNSSPNEAFEVSPEPSPQQSPAQGYCLIIAFVILGFYFIVFGIVELSTNFNSVDYRLPLTRHNFEYTSQNTFISFKQNASIFVYLEIQHLTQFDSDFVIDRETKQCNNYKTNFDMKKSFSINGVTLNPENPAIPCGRQAYFYPEGQFQIINVDDNTSVHISTEDISFQTTSSLFPTSDLYPALQWASFKNQRFRNWMTIDANQKVKKLWGKITQVVSGNYRIRLAGTILINSVHNEMPEVKTFYVTLNNNEALSGYNSELCYLNFFYAVMLFIAALANFLIQSKWGHRKVLKKKLITSGQGNEIKIYLNSAATSPAAKFD